MDVSTSICDDPKFRLLQRRNPEHVAVAFTAYVATIAESWRSGRRVSIDHAWPAFVPFHEAAKAALIDVGLLDRAGMIPVKPWRSWFDPANERRTKSRDRWTRYNAKRDAVTALEPRGNDAGTATSVPPVPSVPSVPTVPTDRSDNNPVESSNGKFAPIGSARPTLVQPTGTDR